MALLLPAGPCHGQDKSKQLQEKPTPTHKDVTYGEHERHVLDFWQAKSDKPTPLVLFIHGGGFVGGSKDQVNPAVLKDLLDAGISVAALNYRLLNHAPLPAAHQDCARALQFLRSKAKVGAFGGSARA
jgi:acetyl esterase/lipase